MAEWSRDAREYVEGYWQQVAALARGQGDDAEEILAGLRDHLARELEACAGDSVSIDDVLKVLAVLGTPEQVLWPEGPPAASRPPVPAPPPSLGPPPPKPPPVQKHVVVNRSPLSCAFAALIVAVLLVVSIVVLSILAAIVLPSLSRAREAARRAACAGNLKFIASALHVIAENNEGRYPPLSPDPGRLMFPPETFQGQSADQAMAFVCPASPNPLGPAGDGWQERYIDDHAYVYLSHVITNQIEGLAYVEAYRSAASAGIGFDVDFVTPDGSVLPRLRGDSTRAPGLPANEIPILVERPEHHVPAGGNVLYLDGHVAFIRLNERFPMTDAFWEALKTIDR